MKKTELLLLIIPLFFICLVFSSCSSIISTVINDNQFSEGDYFFVMYKSNENSISAYGTMTIYYMSNDSTVTGSYETAYNINSILPNSKGGIIGKANWTSGEAKLKLGTSFYSDIELNLHKYIDVVSGDWSSGYSSGKIFAFTKN